MEDGTLAVMVPLMVRALRERSTVVNRRASVIIENMCKLVRVGACCPPHCCYVAASLFETLWVVEAHTLRAALAQIVEVSCAELMHTQTCSLQVQDPAEAAPFLPQLMPLLERVANEAADPELREVGEEGCSACFKHSPPA